MIYIAAISYYDTVGLTTGTKYVSTHGFTTKPTDTPANTKIEGRVKVPALIRRDIFDIGTIGGASRVGFGELELTNDDAGLDVFATYAFDGRDLVVYYANSVAAAFPAGYSILFTGTMEQAEIARDSVKIRVRDRQVFATTALQPNKYAGDNVLPDGVEGNADLAGKPKPLVFGGVFNVEPVCVNTSKLIFQVNDGVIRDLPAVYDAGALLSRYVGTNYASQADMEATEPGEGEYRIWKEGGMFRLGSAPYGQITCDVITGIAPVDRTAGALYNTVLLAAGISSGNISAADITALNAQNSATLGIYVKDEVTNQAVLDDIARSVGAWWASDVAGVMRIKRLDAPSGSPVLAFTNDNIISLQRIPMNDRGLPTFRTTVRGVQNYTVQTSGLVGVVGAARRARLALPYQDATDTDTAVQTAYRLAPETVVETKLSCLGACQTEATRLQALYGVRRDRYEVTVKADAATLAAIDLGVVVSLTIGRFSLSDASLFRILGYQLDPTQGTASLTLWG